jgi:hypothetical protein
MTKSPAKPADRKAPISDLDLLAKLRERGLAPEMADRLQAKLERRDRTLKRFARADDNLATVRRLSEQGHSGADIARLLNISRSYVAKLRKQLGYKRGAGSK